MTDQSHKFDGGKLQYRLVPPLALQEIAKALTYGASKYSPYSWVHVESERYIDAAYRHIQAFRLGSDIDEESGIHHLAMAATNLMFLVERGLTSSLSSVDKPLSFDEEEKSRNK